MLGLITLGTVLNAVGMLTHLILTIPYEGGTVITLISQMVKSLSGQVTCPKPQSVHEGAGTGTRSLAPLTGLSFIVNIFSSILQNGKLL